MKNQFAEQVTGIPIGCQNENPLSSTPSLELTHKVDTMKNMMTQHWQKAPNFVHGIRELMTIGCKISETVKGKLSLGARILQLGGVKRVFKQTSTRREAVEDFPMLFIDSWPSISSSRVAFSSERSVKFNSPNSELVKFHYKTSIPLRKIKRADKSENMTKPSQKYMEIVTVDNFNFWFMGFLNYQKAFNCLQQALSQSQM